jgi:enamine deaminase RidA (YjgF/YER057c/UK114 family)
LIAAETGLISVVGQPPAGARIALEAWHWCGAEISRQDEAVAAKLQNYTAYWFNTPFSGIAGSAAQTSGEFVRLQEFLNSRRCNVADNTVRTWLYCRDVDNNYAGLVSARNDFFAAHGVTEKTGFIASTGIEGCCADPSQLVRMDAVSCTPLEAGQIQHLCALDHLSPTTLYGVSFERGSKIIYGDRAHYYISGTASIDNAGRIMFERDVVNQTRRMVENIEALLREGGAELSDIKSATLYLRDLNDAADVTAVLFEKLPSSLPLVVLRAPVCRSGWLVEMECFAVKAEENGFKVLG